MDYRNDITQEQLKGCLQYDPETGAFTHIKKIRGPRRVGDTAGFVRPQDGYWIIGVLGKQYLGHRLAWLYVTGNFPSNIIDHVNGDRADNRFSNLREATTSQNLMNAKMWPQNTSGYKGVSWDKRARKWASYIKVAGRKKFLGYFDDLESAAACTKSARITLHGEFSNHG